MTAVIDGEGEPAQGAAGLARTMLDAEAERRELQLEDEREALFPDDLLPGVGEEQLTLRQGVTHRRGLTPS